ncbi:MAG: PHB depolymerase family esterase [Actinomycetota bacterium]|nr:PHB depolymerase family esterase [Actinomycetota bacterium]
MNHRPRLPFLVIASLGVAALTSCSGGLADDTATASTAATTTTAAATAATAAATATTTTTTTTVADVPPVEVRAAVAAVGETIEGIVATPDGRTRSYHLYVPSALPAGPVPLLIALHGGTGWGVQFQRNSGFDGLAEANGFLVVFPDGVGTGAQEEDLRTWNGGDCCGAAARKDVDDVVFVDVLIDEIAGQYDVDPLRVFAAGHSNGGILSYRLACELSDRIVAIGLQAGTMGIDECDPAWPVSMLHLHGEDDTNLPIDGGIGPDSIAGVDFASPRESAATFAAAMGCGVTPDVAADASNPDLTITDWAVCGASTEVRFVAVAGAPHAWMGHTPSNPAASPAYQGLDASFEIVQFLLQHPRTG